MAGGAGFATGRAAGDAGRAVRAADAGAVAAGNAGAGFGAATAFVVFFSEVFGGGATFAGVTDFPAAPRAAADLPGAGFTAAALFFGGFAFGAGLDFVVLPGAGLVLETGFPFDGALRDAARGGAAFAAARFPALAFVDADLPPPLVLPGFDAGRLERDAGLFGAGLRAALLPGFFPFTVAISQPFRKPLKMNGAI